MIRAAALAGAAALGLAGAAAGGTGKPALRPVRLQPLEVAGTNFRSGESVLVLVLGGAGRGTRRVTAAADGTWRVTFPTLHARGRLFSVRAHGSKGSVAFWWSRALRPAPAPGQGDGTK